MTQVHLIQQSPFSHSALEDCLRVCAPDDSLVLMHDACYAALSPLTAKVAGIYALKDDIGERGLSEKLQPEIQIIGYSELVTLIAKHRHCQSWF